MTTARRFRLGFDIGGTFTDFVLVDERSGRVSLNKVLTTSREPAAAVIDGLRTLLDRESIRPDDLAIAIHATTLITNALIERKGARTALVTTDGFRDVLEMGTEVRYDIYDLFLEKPEPLVPRRWRFEVAERLDNSGQVLTPLDETGLGEVAERIKVAGVEAVGVAFLHSFRNPAHEQQARAILTAALPNTSICISSEVAPEIREFDRMSTTVANAYVQPLARSYIGDLERRLAADIGYERRTFYMLSSGGITTGDTASAFPIRLVESGPAAGVLAVAYFCRSMALDSVISFDMGGTTAKIGLVRRGEPAKTNMMEVGRVQRFKKGSGLPVKIPVIEMIEIGAGGGQHRVRRRARTAEGGAAERRSRARARLLRARRDRTHGDGRERRARLSRIPHYFLGGAMPLDAPAARRALETRLGGPLGLSVMDAARGVFEVVNQNMLSAMKVHIAERGEDPRKFYLVAFGGAGPAHAYELAKALQDEGRGRATERRQHVRDGAGDDSGVVRLCPVVRHPAEPGELGGARGRVRRHGRRGPGAARRGRRGPRRPRRQRDAPDGPAPPRSGLRAHGGCSRGSVPRRLRRGSRPAVLRPATTTSTVTLTEICRSS